MPWITDEQLTSAVKSVLQLPPSAALPGHWAELITAGNAAGYNFCRAKLGGRGYSPAQMDRWDGRAEWNRRAGLYFTFSEANLDDDQALEQVERLWDRMQDLDELDVTVDGVAVDPDNAGGSGDVGYGDFDTGGDTFTMESTL